MKLLRNISTLYRVPADGAHDDVDAVVDAAVAWDGDTIRYAGPADELPSEFAQAESFDAGGRCVVPGLIDCHTHLCFGGWRGDEFAARLEGASYQDIQAAGGGINATVGATRETDIDSLRSKAAEALADMAGLGVTTVEAKSGYGLDRDNELKQLEVYRHLQTEQPLELVPTFLGAHLVPVEFRDRRADYVELLCEEMIPEVAERELARFCDVFIEDNAFTLREGRRILETAKAHGLGLKIHADQLSCGGGAGLAAELGAVSAEHLEYASDEDIHAMAEAGTVAVSLPIASLYLREPFLPARKWIDAGARVAVATDFNPGSAPSYHLHLAMTLAAVHQRMSPAEVLRGVTTNAARAIGLEASHGSLEPGYRADLAIIDAPDINHWLYHFRPNACRATLKAGRWLPHPP
ncbi:MULTISPECIES: imidazolonepropionase [unclassified Wenzhouxiangella]|uniref:imidazolonepropionase n=1 Tax=unclassified Wenzhouxiangella TaxID=2613841 RepID=UPI000E327359|nr:MULTISPECIES: imidazolonepropionase [unclassified Wenzhouxiangella]RFF27547.1 imidazolonepropionase [Wenzhouxiangella sp. 15181]RFP69591.1 imidazolonepropionase [Wenzhouxiangella sp. 15190]